MELKAYVANYSRTVDYLDSDVDELEFRIDDMDSRIEALEY
ncbi:hypothetical protein [Syntrophothermus lipocalidus]|nr:hypothetical protein [Syntrophothermus lipocalidus]